jgi:sugar lactone lactonase YvrE
MAAPQATQRLTYSHTVGLVAMEGRGFSNPVDLAIASDERIYVVSRTNPDQPYGIRIGICNIDSDYFGDFGDYGPADGAFVWPTSLAFDASDNLYLADEYNHRITVFDRSGGFLAKWGEHGSGPGQLNGPSGICFDSEGNVLVVDHLNNRIQRFDRDGRFLRGWGEEGSGDGQFNLPWGITVDAVGDVFVADWRNDRVQKFSADGRFLAAFGAPGSGDGRFHRPSSVAVDTEGYIYVADWGNERVQVLGSDGGFLQTLKGESTLSKWAEEFYEANSDEWEARQASDVTPELDPEVTTAHEASARIEPYFWAPVSVKLDLHGRLYVVESNRHRIQVYTTG